MKKRILSLLLVLVMVVGLLPTAALAADAEQLPIGGGSTPESYSTSLPDVLDVNDNSEFEFSGTGSENDPYIVDSAAALVHLSTTVNNGNHYSKKYFRQTASIDMTGVNWTPIGTTDNYKYFSGIYDGGNFRIENLTVNNTNIYAVGLFGAVKSGTIRNVIIDKSCSFRAGAYVGGIAGSAASETIENCVNEADVYATGYAKGNYSSRAGAGGIVGYPGASVNIRNCSNYGAISSEANKEYVGGIAGKNPQTIINCHNYGNISGGRCIGGLTATLSKTTMIGCSNHGSVSSSYESSSIAANLDQAVGSTGGLSGWIMSGSVVESCYNTGTVSVDWPGAGGLFGDVGSGVTVNNCYTTGNVRSAYAGEWETAAGAIFGHLKPVRNSIHSFGNLFYLEIGIAAIGVNESTDTFTLPESRNASFMQTEEFLQMLQNYPTQELTVAAWAADTENQNNGYPVLTGTTERQDYHKQITKFTVNSVAMTIDEAAGTVTGMVTNDADLSKLAPKLTISKNATVSPASGEAVDFSKGAVEYTVTAQDGTTKVYTVTLAKPESAKGLMAFQLQGDYAGTSSEKKLILPASDFDQNTLTYHIDCRDGVIDTQLEVWAIPALAKKHCNRVD